jgi:HEPN domain-containing protein
VRKAESDRKTAALALKAGEECPTDAVCFHAQQCVEKYLKALLVLKAIDFEKTHDIGDLVGLLPPRLRPRIKPDDEDTLTTYATLTRYPGPYAEPTLSDARDAVGVARRVRTFVRKHLPRSALAS